MSSTDLLVGVAGATMLLLLLALLLLQHRSRLLRRAMARIDALTVQNESLRALVMRMAGQVRADPTAPPSPDDVQGPTTLH